MKMKRRMLAASVVIASTTIFTNAQICGPTTVLIGVYDSAGKPISNVTFEMLGSVPTDEKFKELSQKYGEENYRYNFELPTAEGEALAKSKLGQLSDKDKCGKPFQKMISAGPADEKDPKFGVCMFEGGSLGEVLIKLSAPGFVTAYYLNNAFRGCGTRAGYTLYRKGEKRPDKQK